MNDKERQEQFAPGPWKHIVNRTTILDANGDRIATVVRKGLYHYTAELIAAAPEMYAVLVGVLKILDLIGFEITIEGRDLQGVISNVLKKARGEE